MTIGSAATKVQQVSCVFIAAVTGGYPAQPVVTQNGW